MEKRGQLLQIEFHYFIVGFLLGLVLALVLVALGTRHVIPFQVPFVCTP